MIDSTPRPMILEDAYADGEDARHFQLRLVDPQATDLAAQPGQFFMLAVPGHGEAPFTYVRAPDAEGRFSALVRRTGQLTEALFELQIGSVLGYRGPLGRGWPHDLTGRHVLVIAGGCGLAPLAGLIDAARDNAARLQVIYGARHPGAQVLARERARWRLDLDYLETCDVASPGERSGSPVAHLDELLGQNIPDAVLCCGPEPLMLASAEHCLKRGVPAVHIWLSLERRMHCGAGLCGHCHIGASYACVDGPTYNYEQYLALTRAAGLYSTAQAIRHC
ncbi:NAD(P)H-flavin reductase [Pseudomonas fluvialis]|uniref:NAD(P)H-flavin reductase n=1 Tax=Pseudomonas fluvialis TaxID=1793966 RepID=A0A7X0BUF2_9PSED|nr:FAD/NAD(P)-binding protein [Pseudomonas fluvialis]MBB6343089.1 NAD(P)H-flavin reductase [Pseudomonas fluvialis]